jgi:hypothetical protein
MSLIHTDRDVLAFAKKNTVMCFYLKYHFCCFRHSPEFDNGKCSKSISVCQDKMAKVADVV